MANVQPSWGKKFRTRLHSIIVSVASGLTYRVTDNGDTRVTSEGDSRIIT